MLTHGAPKTSQNMATGSRATTLRAPAEGKPPRDAARRSRVAWPDVRRAVHEAHETKLVHAVKVRRDGTVDFVLRRDDWPSTKTKEQRPTTDAAQQATTTRKQKRMARKDAFHVRKRAEAAAALGLQSSQPLLPPRPPPPAAGRTAGGDGARTPPAMTLADEMNSESRAISRGWKWTSGADGRLQLIRASTSDGSPRTARGGGSGRGTGDGRGQCADGGGRGGASPSKAA